MNPIKMLTGDVDVTAMPSCGNFTATYGNQQQQQQPQQQPSPMPPAAIQQHQQQQPQMQPQQQRPPPSLTPTQQQQQQASQQLPPPSQQQYLMPQMPQQPIMQPQQQQPMQQQQQPQPQQSMFAQYAPEYAMTLPQQQTAMSYLQNQQQQHQHMMPMPSLNLSTADFNNRSDAAAALLANNGEKRQPMNMNYDAFRTLEEVRRNYVTGELASDFEKVRAMTLLDDCKYLDTLYVTQMMFTDTKYTIATLLTMYREKYKTLFDKYPGLETYFLVGLSFIGYRSLLEFKANVQQSRNGGSGALTIPNVGFKSNRLISVRQRMLAAARGAVASKQQQQQHQGGGSGGGGGGGDNGNNEGGGGGNGVEQGGGGGNGGNGGNGGDGGNDGGDENNATVVEDIGDTDERLVREHPFFKSPLIFQRRMLFELGRLVDFCLPYDFARLVVDFHQATVKRYLANKAHEFYQGLRLCFRVPVLTIIRRRTVNGQKSATFNYANLENLTAVGEMLTYYTGQRLDMDAFSLGSRLEMNKVDVELTSGVSKSSSDDVGGVPAEKGADDLEFTFMSNFDVIATNVGVAGIKGFSSKTFILRQRSVICPEETVENFTKIYEQKMETHTEELGQWYMSKLLEDSPSLQSSLQSAVSASDILSTMTETSSSSSSPSPQKQQQQQQRLDGNKKKNKTVDFAIATSNNVSSSAATTTTTVNDNNNYKTTITGAMKRGAAAVAAAATNNVFDDDTDDDDDDEEGGGADGRENSSNGGINYQDNDEIVAARAAERLRKKVRAI